MSNLVHCSAAVQQGTVYQCGAHLWWDWHIALHLSRLAEQCHQLASISQTASNLVHDATGGTNNQVLCTVCVLDTRQADSQQWQHLTALDVLDLTVQELTKPLHDCQCSMVTAAYLT